MTSTFYQEIFKSLDKLKRSIPTTTFNMAMAKIRTDKAKTITIHKHQWTSMRIRELL